MATAGRKPREPLPKGEEAEKELERQRRNQRRALRRAKKSAEARGEDPNAVSVSQLEGGLPWDVPPVGDGGVPSAEQLKAQLWGAFHELGGQAGLVLWGRRYPKEFYAIWARLCLPKPGSEAPAENTLEAMLAKIGDDDE